MRNHFLWMFIPVNAFLFLLAFYVDKMFYGLVLFAIPITLIGLHDVFQKKHTILRNYPIFGHFRYLLESIRPEIQQYFVERFDDGRPFSREQRSVVYQRAKGDTDKSAFGTQHDVYAAGAEWLEHSMNPAEEINEGEGRVLIGNEQCSKPYSASRLNISAMSYGSLSKTAVEALNWGAKLGGLFHNTGEGGISPYHLKHGGDLCWQVGTGYFGCRNSDGTFNADMFKEKSSLEQIKLIELKISQGAKPGHGGILPGEKVNEEVAAIRAVEMGKDVISPSNHSAFTGPKGLIKFIQNLRDLSGGKPVGFKLCIGKKIEFYAIIKAMIELDIYPDFITVDGAEGGTGAAPREFANSLGTPLNDALHFVHSSLIAAGIREKMVLIASGKVVDAFNLVSKFSLGADLCNSARGMMFAVGCIQALRCHSNNCPAGVATQEPKLYKLLDVESKSKRVARFHKKTMQELYELLAASGVSRIRDIKKSHIKRRIGPGEILNYAEVFPKMEPNSLVDGSYQGKWRRVWDSATTEHF
ncbi:MAG: FMN-binding glutamate synthase family protein [Halobacteriovoraceae bacterium]|nr:FMN-binding glutamate synthase family protein [Halobacteriovoraceae bacterium]